MKLLLFDGFSILNRAFYAIPLLTSSTGEYTNAIYGFLNIFFRFCDEEKPDYVTVAFDLPKPTFRHERYGAYKGTRKGMPDELRAQVPVLKELLIKMQIHTAECEGFEADDVIGTLAAKAVALDVTPVIISGDRDLLQLATDRIKIRLPKTKAGKTEVEDYYAADVLAKYGVTPRAYIDVKALMGDTSDNIPGVPSIGEVTATKIITTYGTLENAIENASEVKPKKASANLVEFKDQAILSQMLATIVQDAPIELELCPPNNIANAETHSEIQKLGLKSLYKRFEIGQTDTVLPKKEFSFRTINEPQEIKDFFINLENKTAALCLLWDKINKVPQLVGMGITTQGSSVYIPTAGELSLDSKPAVSGVELLNLAKPWLQCGSKKVVYDIKPEIERLRYFYDIYLNGITFDTKLAAYIIDPLKPNKTPSDIFQIYLQETSKTLDELLENKGKRSKERRTIADIPQETAANYAAKTSDLLLQVTPILKEHLNNNDQMKLYKNMEHPLAYVLADMEQVGIKVDREFLLSYGKTLNTRINKLTSEIHEYAMEDFNINSPAQLGVILFEKLGLKGGKKTPKAGYSTAADVLEKLKSKHPIISLVLEYRAYSKLKSTYIDGLLPLITEDSRIHSTFHQALTATGRLSSAEPNLQNIPVRLEIGRELRKAFIPKEGCVFIDADYSQIELRLLAHMSGDKVLINAFKENADIHRLTAAQVLGIPPGEVTAEQRSNAKAVNFGIVYGISAYGLSDDLDISVKEAEGYIKGYFEKYPDVKTYLDNTIKTAKEKGYVSTLYNRRRPMVELNSSNYNTRSFGERVAMNMPIQGTAADIIKIAMINVYNRLIEEKLKSKLILQVHDELLIEAPMDEQEKVVKILSEEMEQAVTLKVPLVSDVNVGGSWYATK